MKVRLLQNIKGMGQKGDIKEVSEGQARNMLFPKKMAEPATAQVINEKAQQDKKRQHAQEEGEQLKQKRHDLLNNKTLSVHAEKTPQGTLYKSITKKVIVEEILKQFKMSVKESDVLLDEPIHKIGESTVKIHCLDKQTTNLKIQVS
ncbi:MAG TPA: 50S ribosomal protein L9 [Candidatus Paceibacterota bacterium]